MGFQVVATILHLGNVDFSKGKDTYSSKLKYDKAMFHLKMAAKIFMYGLFPRLNYVLCASSVVFYILSMLSSKLIYYNDSLFSPYPRCDVKDLEDSLCKRVIVTRDESITKTLDPVAAATNQDALGKATYSRLFDWYGLSCLMFSASLESDIKN